MLPVDLKNKVVLISESGMIGHNDHTNEVNTVLIRRLEVFIIQRSLTVF